jgi:LSD1 subclass zinc finger protein
VGTVRIVCTQCGIPLKAPDGKAKVRCGGCGTVLRVPQPSAPSEVEPSPKPTSAREQAEEEVFDMVEEPDEPVPVKRQVRRTRGPKKRSPYAVMGNYLWLIASGLACASFVVSLAVRFVEYGMSGLPNRRVNPSTHFGFLLLFAVGSLVFVVAGITAPHTRTFRGRFGQVATGPYAVGIGMFLSLVGGAFGGVIAYGLLFYLIRGR